MNDLTPEQITRLNRLYNESVELRTLWRILEDDYLSFNPNISKHHVEEAKKRLDAKIKEYNNYRKECNLSPM